MVRVVGVIVLAVAVLDVMIALGVVVFDVAALGVAVLDSLVVASFSNLACLVDRTCLLLGV